MISVRHYERLSNLIRDTKGDVIIGGKTDPEKSQFKIFSNNYYSVHPNYFFVTFKNT